MKRERSKFLVYPITVLFLGFMLIAYIAPSDGVIKDWDVPAKYKEMKNPYTADKSLDKVGKMLYAKHCKSCHGNVGLGDGPKAASMDAEMMPFNDAAFQAQSDGVIYYQTVVGRNEMPNFEKKIPEEEDRWALINFIRTL